MVEASIFVSFKFGGPLVLFFFKWYCGLTCLMFPGRTGWLFNYFARTHMTIFEGRFLITYCLVLWWWWFFSPTRYSFQGKIPFAFLVFQNKNTEMLLLVVHPHPTYPYDTLFPTPALPRKGSWFGSTFLSWLWRLIIYRQMQPQEPQCWEVFGSILAQNIPFHQPSKN